MADEKVVGMHGQPLDIASGQTSADIIKLLEDTLAAARAGKMVGVAIATMMERERRCDTAHSIDFGYHTEMLGTLDIVKHRLRMRILDFNP